jgi:hypothetical protein
VFSLVSSAGLPSPSLPLSRAPLLLKRASAWAHGDVSLALRMVTCCCHVLLPRVAPSIVTCFSLHCHVPTAHSDVSLLCHVSPGRGSAEKDPAVGLFKTYWGEKWAEDFTHNFLFSMSEPPPKTAPAGPVVSGAGASTRNPTT